MSTSRRGADKPRYKKPKQDVGRTDFDDWLVASFEAEGPFTALVILVRIGPLEVAPLASTFLSVIGAEIRWPEIVALFGGSGHKWDGAAFFPVLDAGGPLLNAEARARLRALEARVREDRLTLNDGHFFDTWGRRLKVEEATPN
ncbi:hypothetical protein [Aquabacter spiritensis]|uniref:Uncharacterized protein n=1 Tax=Aquabacter spiritensis TaxID=933073 RepID=A0A4R3LQ73_9HYPH|nr:hypothetical protein [Aquabacter spiritensis]TCT02704.1 hypothetical protein EDC64_112143 [Aquabacter spiritensis]